MAEQLRGSLPNLVAFALGFALVASIWWEHPKLVARLAYLDPRSTALNLLALGLAALAPFPIGLIGEAPTVRAAALPFIATSVVLMAVFLALIGRVQRTGAWREAPNPRLFRWVIAGWWAELAGLLLTLLVALAAPSRAWRWRRRCRRSSPRVHEPAGAARLRRLGVSPSTAVRR